MAEVINVLESSLNPTSQKILADRYLGKGGELEAGAKVVAILEIEQQDFLTGKMKKREIRELGIVQSINDTEKDKREVVVQLADGHFETLPESKVDVLKEVTVEELFDRIAKGITEAYEQGDLTKEEYDQKMDEWTKNFNEILEELDYVPGGRILASMGAKDEEGRNVKTTSYNCFVIQNVGPTVKQFAISFGRTLEIQARSGGVGMNLSLVPPQGKIVEKSEVKRSNMQLVMDVWHPDLYDFVQERDIQDIDDPYKHSTKFVKINDSFKKAAQNNETWTFEFPDTKAFKEEFSDLNYDDVWTGDLYAWKEAGYPVVEAETVDARKLYQDILDTNTGIIENDLLFSVGVKPGDSRGTIAEALGQTWEHLIEGSPVAINLSSMRPRYARVIGVNGRSSGAYSWGALYDRANWAFAEGFGPVAVAQMMSIGCLLVIQGGSRRGALMIVLNDWHENILDFIQAKRDNSIINGANISVGVSEEFMAAKEGDNRWKLGYVKEELFDSYKDKFHVDPEDFVATTDITVSEIWDEMMESAHASAEPGVIFMGRYNDMSNSWYFNPIIATNPLNYSGV